MTWDDVRAGSPSVTQRTSRLSLEPLAISLLKRLMTKLEHGSLVIELPSGMKVEARGAKPGPNVCLALESWAALWRVIRGGDIGFAEAYMAGDWSSPDLTSLLESMSRNEQAIEAAWQGLAATRLLGRLRHHARANTRRGSRRNVEAHYDLSNKFYATWLDEGMNYSSALYARPSLSLEEAQVAKLDRAIALLEPKPGDNVLEIGCGWGALAERLATHRGCRITGITLSREQLAYAQQRIRRAAIEDRVELRLQDYRDVTGQFDRVVSIEMLEAAGEAFWPVYFNQLRSRLAQGGSAVLQVITIDEDRFSNYRRRPDFIQRYIFPGGMLPTIAIIENQLAAAGLTLRSLELFGESYARTLADWRVRYARAKPPEKEKSLGTARFRRKWNYYLAYCEAGFRTGALNVGLYQIAHK